MLLPGRSAAGSALRARSAVARRQHGRVLRTALRSDDKGLVWVFQEIFPHLKESVREIEEYLLFKCPVDTFQ